MKWISQKAVKKGENREQRALGHLLLHCKPGMNNQWIYWKPQQFPVAPRTNIISSLSIPNEENMIADTFFFSMLI